MEPASSSADPDWGVFKYAVTLGVRCCHLSWVNWVRASRRVRPAPPRLVRRRSLLRGQIFGVRRRNMGTKPRGQRCWNWGCPALSQRSASPDRAGLALLVDGGL